MQLRDLEKMHLYPILYLLLKDGLARASKSPEVGPIIQRMKLVHCDSREYLEKIPASDLPHVVYMDPMYPPKRKIFALPKKEILASRMWLGPDRDSQSLFEIAHKVATKRVIWKRPAHYTPEPTATRVIKSNLVLYEIYNTDPNVTHEKEDNEIEEEKEME